MSDADTLRRVAEAIRKDYSAAEMSNGKDDPFMFAVADWLDVVARRWPTGRSSVTRERAAALAVANAY